MENTDVQSNRKRSIKPKTQYSPSNITTAALYHLINYDDTRKMMIVATSSIKKVIGDDTVILNDYRTAKLIISGTKEKCLEQWNKRKLLSQADNNDERDEIDVSQEIQQTFQMPKKSFFTPDPFRRNIALNNRSISPDSNCLPPSPKRFAHSNRGDNSTKYTPNGSSITRHPIPVNRIISSSSDEDEVVNENNKAQFSDILNELRNAQAALKESSAENRAVLNKLTRKVAELRPSALLKRDLNLDRFRIPNDEENFKKEIIFEDQNLLDIAARNPGEYSRMLLRTLFRPSELEICLLPSSYSKRFAKPELDLNRFNLLNEAIRCRYRISKEHYHIFYKDIIQETLATCLYNEGRRKNKRETIQQERQHMLSSDPQQTLRNNIVITNNEQENYEN